MRGFRGGRLAAVIGFTLVAGVVLGGMTWATISTWQLAKINVEREYRDRLNRAVWRMDSYMGGILDREMARPFTHYMPYYTDEPVHVYLGKSEVAADRVVLDSPIAKPGSRHRWIRFYFQVDEDGRWSSPQHACDAGVCNCPLSSQAECVCVHTSLDWLKGVLPLADLGDRVRQARERDDALGAHPTRPQQTQAVKITRRFAGGEARGQRRPRTEYDRRVQRKRAGQLRSRPPSQCVNPKPPKEDIADIVTADREVPEPAELASVGIYGDPLASFWLESTTGQSPNLAFVRTGHRDAQLVYQGFIGDWARLKPELLAEIADLLDGADLQPAPDDSPSDPELSDITMNTIPVRLSIPDRAAATTTGLAWESVGSVLLVTWAAAAGVLVVAGIGFRNLIALTERRMQFAYAVTHELRTPLTTFRLYSDMLSAGLVPDKSKQEYLDTLNRESLRLSNLVEGVLEYARLENHRVSLNPVDVDAESLLNVISEGLEKRCGECGVEPRVHNEISNGLPLRTDVDVVNQIAGVLINNACRHTQGADEPRVLVRLGEQNGKVHVDVIDSGSGIEHRDARAIFKPFRRGRKADAAAQGGIGLGLALARTWAVLLGGRLDLVARHDRELGGAHFRLTIPART